MSYLHITSSQWYSLTRDLTGRQYIKLIREYDNDGDRVKAIALGKITKRQDIINYALNLLRPTLCLVVNQSTPFNYNFKITGHLKLVI